MPIVKCHICGNSFYAKPNWLKKGWGKYCSAECRSRAQFNGRNVKCFICDKEIYRSLKGLGRSKSNKFFCTKRCQTIWRNTILFSGESHSNWKYGEYASRRILKTTGKELICNLCETKDARVLIVHHIDKNRHNNKAANLAWLCHNCHYLVHHFDDERGKLVNLLDMKNMVDVAQSV